MGMDVSLVKKRVIFNLMGGALSNDIMLEGQKYVAIGCDVIVFFKRRSLSSDVTLEGQASLLLAVTSLSEVRA